LRCQLRVEHIRNVLFGKSKVSKSDVTKMVHQNVFKFQVAIDNTRVVEMVKRKDKFGSIEAKGERVLF